MRHDKATITTFEHQMLNWHKPGFIWPVQLAVDIWILEVSSAAICSNI